MSLGGAPDALDQVEFGEFFVEKRVAGLGQNRTVRKGKNGNIGATGELNCFRFVGITGVDIVVIKVDPVVLEESLGANAVATPARALKLDGC